MQHARITAHKGILVVELLPDQLADQSPNQSNGEAASTSKLRNLGTVVHDTGRYLGVSAEALTLLTMVKRGIDRIGDFAWFSGDDGKDHFAWLGGPKRLVNPAIVEAARTYEILAHRVVPNEVPEGARMAIEANF